MPPLRCLFLGYLWPIAHAIKRSSKAVLVNCGVELQRSKTQEMVNFCEREEIPWFDAKSIRSNSEFDRTALQKIDLIVVGAFGQILDKRILGIPRYGVLNFHPSLLPSYKGGSPIEEMILAGDSRGGVTFHWMVEKVDQGPIVMSEEVTIGSEEDYPTVLNNCVNKGEKMMGQLLKIPINEWPQQEQGLSTESQYAMRKPEDGLIDWKTDIEKVHRIILALGWRGWVRAVSEKGELVVRRAKIASRKNLGLPGEIISVEPSVIVGCNHGALELLEYSFHRALVKGEMIV
jgi:methionyl-tRNA formyltransferase